MFRIYPYKVGSASVKKLKTALNAKIIKLEGSKYRHRAEHFVINWGNSRRISVVEGVNMLNEPANVAIAADKLKTFEKLEEQGVLTVPWTIISSTANAWLAEGHKVFVRNVLHGHSGEGIEVVTPSTAPVLSEAQEERSLNLMAYLAEFEELGESELVEVVEGILDDMEPEGMTTDTTVPTAPLYTRGVANNGEYRVHVVDGEVILYQKKSRRVNEDGEVETAEGQDADVRNLASNWIYRTGNLERLERVEQLAISAIEALGLDFGAVDIIKDNDGNVFVLEVNSAPGLGNADSLEAYTEAFNNLI